MASAQADQVEPVSFGSPQYASTEVCGLLVTHAIFPPHGRLCAHVHDRTCVATTLHGRFASGMRGRSHWSRPSMVLTEPAGERHDNVFGASGAHVLVVQPDAARCEVFRPFTQFLDSINHFHDPAIGVLARRIGVEIAQPDEVSPLVIEALGLELLATAARRLAPKRAETSAPQWLRRVRERLHDTFAQPLTLTELAAIAGVHPAHLARVFRRHYRCSVGAYQRELRLEWSARRLALGNGSLAEVATSAGFSDQSHLTRAFKRRFGSTPGVFRARARHAPRTT
jgi:AraC family transcriptional regulator